MASEVFCLTFLRAELALSIGLLVAIALRGWVRQRIGPILAYRLWLMGPIAAITSLFPTLQEFVRQGRLCTTTLPEAVMGNCLRPMTDKALWGTPSYALVGAWLVGATTLCFVFILAELRFRRLVKCGLVGPAVVGVAYPRLVVPHDFAERFTVQEQAFIRRHERAHMVRHDTLINLLIASAQVFGWFNPLIHLAARQIRLDQELACDAQALAGRPTDRRAYGETLVRVHLAGRTTSSNLGCAWTPLGRHPLETRLANLIQIEPDLRQGVCGAVAIATLCVAISITVWSLAPSSRQNLAAAAPIATASADIQN